jgi:2-polyprenyl-3-methyl-5-hydroxy-6-metoxy-1,4-benzoquinol methylase
MRNILPGKYTLDEDTKIWSRSNYRGISYSDGDHEEDEVLHMVERASDVSVLSPDLKKGISNWTTAYHLSNLRSNLLRPYKGAFAGKRILEIGAGCGAITRFLGESDGIVLALEGTHRRAKIARSRTRDLPNVQVVCESFSELEVSESFDIITLIGVLEYANLFVESENPHQAMLEKVATLLSPGGQLIVAIENQLGLKYFAGAKEDHLGIPFYGIEDRYQSNQPTTFGKVELTQLIRRSGFDEPNFLYPFPDYKMPHCIVSEQGFSHPVFNPSELIAQSLPKDPQYPKLPSFQMDMAIPAIIRNELATHLSNSFLINASIRGSADASIIVPEALAWHFSASRKANYVKEIEFLLREEQVVVRSELKQSDALSSSGRIQQVVDDSPYVSGHSLTFEIAQRVQVAASKPAILQASLLEYIKFICQKGQITPSGTINENALIDPGLLDATPSNIILGPDGSWQLIDQEWRSKEDLQLGYLVFRALLTLAGSHSLRTQFSDYPTDHAFVRACLTLVFGSVNDKLYKQYCQRESELQSEISGIDPRLEQILLLDSNQTDSYRDVAEFYSTQYRECLEIRRGIPEFKATVSGLEQHIAFLNGIVASNEIAIKQSNFNAYLQETDLAAAKASAARLEATLSSMLKESDQLRAQLAGVQSSRVWRVASAVKRLLSFSK